MSSLPRGHIPSLSPAALSRLGVTLALLAAIFAILLYQEPSPTEFIPAPTGTPPRRTLLEEGGKRGYNPHYYPGANDAPLPWGNTHYYLVGPENGPKVALVHGISIPAIIYTDQVDLLVNSGYQVLVYDLYGRGYSDSPGVQSTKALYTTQLHHLLLHVGWSKCSIIGLSMGGGIAVAFAAAFPEMTDHLILMGPVGLVKEEYYATAYFLGRVPYFMELLNGALTLLAKIPWEFWVVDWVDLREGTLLMTDIESIRHNRGFLRAFMSSVRHYPLFSLHEDYAKAGLLPDGTPRKVMALWGDADEVCPYDGAITALGLIPTLDLVTIPGAGHVIGVNYPEVVNAAILRFLPPASA